MGLDSARVHRSERGTLGFEDVGNTQGLGDCICVKVHCAKTRWTALGSKVIEVGAVFSSVDLDSTDSDPVLRSGS